MAFELRGGCLRCHLLPSAGAAGSGERQRREAAARGSGRRRGEASGVCAQQPGGGNGDGQLAVVSRRRIRRVRFRTVGELPLGTARRED